MPPHDLGRSAVWKQVLLSKIHLPNINRKHKKSCWKQLNDANPQIFSWHLVYWAESISMRTDDPFNISSPHYLPTLLCHLIFIIYSLFFFSFYIWEHREADWWWEQRSLISPALFFLFFLNPSPTTPFLKNGYALSFLSLEWEETKKLSIAQPIYDSLKLTCLECSVKLTDLLSM